MNLAGPTEGTYTRGIAFYNNSGKVRVVMDNCTASANYYAINVARNNKEIELTIKNSTITGWCAAQTWSANSKLTFENCTLTGVNDKEYNQDRWNDFATIVVNDEATGSELSFQNCRIEANQTTGNTQYFLIQNAESTISFTGCTFVIDGQEIAKDQVMSHVEWASNYADGISIN